ncbi:MAG: short-chain fatty acyl-CoA regulator family protein [Myxococcota bacterium]
MEDHGLGAKLRAVRRREGLTQVQLAERLGISASYLNLIEHGRRPLPAALLIELARQLRVDLAAFAPDADLQLEASVREALADPMFDEHGLVGADVRELVRGSPLVARAVVTLYRAYREAREAADLPDRDPTDDELPAGSLAAGDRVALSTEQVSDFVQHRSNWFPELEDAAGALWRDAKLDAADIGPGLERWLREALGVSIRFEPANRGATTRRFDPDARELVLSELLPPRSRQFELAHQIALLQHGEVIDRIARDDRLTTDESRTLCRVVLASWFAGAVLMPYDRLLSAARELRYDVELLGHRFRTSWEQVCHRLTSLRRPGAEGVPFHLIRVDVAGNISKRFTASGIRFPRFSGVCARWSVFQAFQTPGLVRTQVSRMPDDTMYFCFSRTVRRESGGFHAPHAVHAVGMGCRLEHGRQLVYSDGIDLEGPSVPGGPAATPIGVTCRTCERSDCAQRVCPAVDHPIRIDPNVRGVSLFAPPGGR